MYQLLQKKWSPILGWTHDLLILRGANLQAKKPKFIRFNLEESLSTPSKGKICNMQNMKD